MKKKLTVYCINYGKSENVFLAIADNSIPFKVISRYFDVEESLIFEGLINKEKLPIAKKVCKDTNKSAILLRNQEIPILRDFVNEILGNQVTFINYSFKQWKYFILGMEEYSTENSSIIEIDHPIYFDNEILSSIMKEGIEMFEVKQREMKQRFDEIKKKCKKEKKKNGK